MEEWRRRRRRLAALGLVLVALFASLLVAFKGRPKPSSGRPVYVAETTGGGFEWRSGLREVTDPVRAGGWRGLLLGVPLDPNKASKEDWDALPGVGGAGATELIKARERLGGFSTEADILEAKGIGPKKLEAMRRWIRIAPPGV